MSIPLPFGGRESGEIHLLALGFSLACSIAQIILAPKFPPDSHGNMT